jgi:hypothetical protein
MAIPYIRESYACIWSAALKWKPHWTFQKQFAIICLQCVLHLGKFLFSF